MFYRPLTDFIFAKTYISLPWC